MDGLAVAGYCRIPHTPEIDAKQQDGSQSFSNSRLFSMSTRAIRGTLEPPLCHFNGNAKISTMFSRPIDGLEELLFSILVSRLSRRFRRDDAEAPRAPSSHRTLHSRCSKDWQYILNRATLLYKPSTVLFQLKFLLSLIPFAGSAFATTAPLGALADEDTKRSYNFAVSLARGEKGVDRDVPQAVQILSNIINESGLVSAMTGLAHLLRKGDGVQKDVPRAVELYKRAIDEGQCIYAMHELAFLFEKGEGLPKDLSRAVQLYLRAISEGGYTPSMINLGFLFARGVEGLQKDMGLAAQLYEIAIEESQSTYAMHELAFLLEKGEDGVRKDLPRAVQLYERAIGEGQMAISMNNLGLLFVRGGEGVEKNHPLAVELFTRAIDEGENILAMCNLADLLHVGGEGVRKDLRRAVSLYQRAIDEGQSTYAMHQLAFLLETGGFGVEKDLVRAVRLYVRAIDEGNLTMSMNNLAFLVSRGGLSVRMYGAKAVRLYERAIEEGGEILAMTNLADLLRVGGIGVKKDVTRAMQLYGRAVEGGSTYATCQLALLRSRGIDRGKRSSSRASMPWRQRQRLNKSQESCQKTPSVEYPGVLFGRGAGDAAIRVPGCMLPRLMGIFDKHDTHDRPRLTNADKNTSSGDLHMASHHTLVTQQPRAKKATRERIHIRNEMKTEERKENSVRQRVRAMTGLADWSRPCEHTGVIESHEMDFLKGDDEGPVFSLRGFEESSTLNAAHAGDLIQNAIPEDDSTCSNASDLLDPFPFSSAKDSAWNVQTQNDRFLFLNKENKSFIVFMCDFFMAYDDDNDLLLILVPLSKAIVVSPEKLSMNNLLDEVPEEQVQFIARRLVQLTAISWRYDCLARLEQSLPGAERLAQITNLFDGKSLDLGPCSLDSLTGCKVGIVNWNIRDLPHSYDAGLELFGTVVGLPRGKDGIANPEVLSNSHLTFDISITDYIDISIGGKHDGVMSIPDVEEKEELNLSYMPQNLEFQKLRSVEYALPEELERAFLALGYGEQFSAVLRRTATTHFSGKKLTLESVQGFLLRSWRKCGHWNLVPLTFNFAEKKFLRRDTPFLVINAGKLYVAKSSKIIQRNMTIGLHTDFLVATAGRTSLPSDIVTLGPVCNLLDAAEHLHGPRTGFERCRGEGNWYKVHKRGMSDILGALTLVSVMLKGKVLPAGEFKGCVPPGNLEEMKCQRVDFNIPVPYGVAYSTFADGCEPDINAEVVSGPIVYRLNGSRWDLAKNYKHPAVLAGPMHSQHVHHALFHENLEPAAREAPVRNRWRFAQLFASSRS